jgi:hypothetical protein
VIPLNVRDFSAIDGQMDGKFSPNVRSSLYNQASAAVAGARLERNAADEECARKSQNQKKPAAEVVS